MERKDVYQIITDRIVGMLEKGIVPWHKPWQYDEAPENLASHTKYHGFNILMLAVTRMEKEYSTPYWLTYNQARKLKGQVKKGEHGYPVVYWNFVEKQIIDEETGDIRRKTIPFLRYYTVFNANQVDLPEGTVPKPEVRQHNPIAACEEIQEGYKDCPDVKYGGGRAYYNFKTDFIGMPAKESFDNSEAFYGTLFHEMIHSTGHTSRLNRPNFEQASFGGQDYSKEELTAEMGSLFLCSRAGIDKPVIDNSAAYIQGWLTHLQNDKRMVVSAAGKAQKAADFILA